MRSRPALQRAFLDQCLHTDKSLGRVMIDMQIMPEQVARWLATRSFRRQLGRARREARRLRDLQIEVGAWRAAQVLTEIALCDDAKARPVVRQACTDLIKLARDARARTISDRAAPSMPPARTHPDLDPDEQTRLTQQLAREDA